MLPASVSLTDVVSEVLHVSSDSAYRRIRNETPLVLQEAKQLCEHFSLSLDQVLSLGSNSILLKISGLIINSTLTKNIFPILLDW